MSWYAIFVKTGCEDDICFALDHIMSNSSQEIRYNLLVPKRKIYECKQGIRREVVKKLFPGYVLVQTDDIMRFYLNAKKWPRVLRFLKAGGTFLQVNYKEIRQILSMVDTQGLINISEGFYENEKIKIISGPLIGMEGIIKKVDKRNGRVKVEISINCQKHLIYLGINELQCPGLYSNFTNL